MVNDIVRLLVRCASSTISLFNFMTNSMGLRGLVFAAISMVVFTRFLLGPLVGYTHAGASDKAKSAVLSLIKKG